MSVDDSNSTMTFEYPSTEVDVSSLTSEIVFSSSSILRVTRLSTSAGDTPGYTVLTAMIGISASGKDSFGIVQYDSRPAMAMNTKSTMTEVEWSTAMEVSRNSLKTRPSLSVPGPA